MMMKISEEVFRHEVLNTSFLTVMISKKQEWDVCNNDLVPWTCGVHPANESPDENLNITPSQISWISNTDPSFKPGTHWVCILQDVECVSKLEQDEMENCHRVVYYIIDSWGLKYTDKTCKHIIENLEDSFNIANFNHVTHMAARSLCCKCEFEINFPVDKRIQHLTFENCGWYALQFCDMEKDDLIKWANSNLNEYGQIKANYENMVKYFTQTFFPTVVKLPCENYTQFKLYVSDKLPSCSCNQGCCCQKYALPEYY